MTRQLNEKYQAVLANKPKERRAMIIANSKIKAIVEARGLDYNNKDDKKEIKKISSVEMQRAREQVGANSSKTKIVFSDREWEAVQKHAISDSLLQSFRLQNSVKQKQCSLVDTPMSKLPKLVAFRSPRFTML